ncbi:hypothetical protein AXG93_2566s1130 [Marchantia polymorpha subsp. ruderalis]|uniref:Uncharacterized protein n=1 Tax=Marchantia polymorpha subsp. ruderalis TaxID=1480154 RepID=A0A176VBV5_MARPO|nr:hypothetical protein AXG93_2566s1130 [Marchantia polymorpha subsp. ruderalis]
MEATRRAVLLRRKAVSLRQSGLSWKLRPPGLRKMDLSRKVFDLRVEIFGSSREHCTGSVVNPVALKKKVDVVVEGVAGEATAAQLVASTRTSTGEVILETREDPLAEEIQSEGINVADVICEQVVPLLRYLNSKLEKFAGPSNVGSYVGLVRNKTRVKVAAANATVEKVESLTTQRAAVKTSSEEKEKQLHEFEAKYEVLQKRLIKEIELQKFSEKAYESLQVDIETTRRATVDLRDRLEAYRMAFNE